MPLVLWVGFTLFILAMLALDLGVFQRRPHVVGTAEALAWFAFWTGLAALFAVGILIFHPRGGEAGLEFVTGFLIEKSLSIDNIFVFILIFEYFRVPRIYQHKVLFWGIVGAIALRMTFIVGGLALMSRFHWVVYLFGGFLVVTGIAMMRRRESRFDPAENRIVRAFRRLVPVADRFHGNRFWVRVDGRLVATPLLLVLVAIESSDIVFAVDSIPAIFAVTPDPFVVYTSNVFAMLGLRSLYFAVAGFIRMFWFLHYGFASIILVLGVKMLLSDVYELPIAVPLVFVIVVLLASVIVSLLRPRPADVKAFLERSERLGLIPFRRLLLMENVIDLAGLTARDAMRPRAEAAVLEPGRPWSEALATIRGTRFSRFPLVRAGAARPSGIVHVKDLFLADGRAPPGEEQLERLARPFACVREDAPLEEVLATFQRTDQQMAVVENERGEWSGLVTIEDVLEQLVGSIGDEFDPTRARRGAPLADLLDPARVVLDLDAGTLDEAVRELVTRIPRAALPADPDAILGALAPEPAAFHVEVGLAVPRARLPGLEQPVLAFGRSAEGLLLGEGEERAHLLFLLLAPDGAPRPERAVAAELEALLESEYVARRLRGARTPEEIVEALAAGEQVAAD